MPYDDDEYIFDDAGIDDMPVFPESRGFAGLDNYEKMSLRDYIARVFGNIRSVPSDSRRNTNWWKSVNERWAYWRKIGISR